MAAPSTVRASRAPLPTKAPPTVVHPSGAPLSSTANFLQRTGGSNQLALTAIEQEKAANVGEAPQVGSQRWAKLPPLSDETRAEMIASVELIVRILKRGTPDAGDQTYLLEAVRTWERRDHDLSLMERGGRRTPMLDHFLILLKSRAYSRTTFRIPGTDVFTVEQHAIAYDTLWYVLRGYWLEEFKRAVQSSETQSTNGAQAKDIENGAALIAKQEAMGLWGMLKGMGTGLVSIAGPEAAQYIAAQFDETAHILFGHEWDSSEPLVWGMNAGQIGTAGGDVIMQLAMFARSAGAKGGRILALLANLDKFKKAHQVLAALGGVQGMLMASKGILDLIDNRQKTGQEVTAVALLADPAFVNLLVMLVSSGVGTVLAVKGPPTSAQKTATRAIVGGLLGSAQVASSLNEIAAIARSEDSDAEKELAYGRVLVGLIPQLVNLAVDAHSIGQGRKDAKAESRAIAQEKADATARAGDMEPASESNAAQPQADTEAVGAKAMSKPAEREEVPQRKPSNKELEQARLRITDAHQAQMADEVTNRLSPREALPPEADLVAGLREPLYAPPKRGSITVGEPQTTLAAAQALYDRVVAETGASREVGIWHHPDTGEYVVRLGQITAVGPASDTAWQGVQHFHPNLADVPLWRMPSGSDIAELAGRAIGQKRALAEIVEYPLPQGRRGRVAYTAMPDGKLKVEFINAEQVRVVKTFDGAQDFEGYHPARKVFDAESIRAEVDQWLADRRNGSLMPDTDDGTKRMAWPAKKLPAGGGPSTTAPKDVSDKPDMVEARRLAAAEKKRAKAEWEKSSQTPQGQAAAQASAGRKPGKDDNRFDKLFDSPAGRNFEPRPTINEQQVAVRIRGDSENKGKFIIGPEDPQDIKNASPAFKDASKTKEYLVLPLSEATELGFIPKSADSSFEGKIEPLRLKGVPVESSMAGEATHPITARTSPKGSKKKGDTAWDRTIEPSLSESEGYKWLLATKQEFGLKRPGNASTGGVDAVTVEVNGSVAKVFLNDMTTPDQPKKPKDTHQDWRNAIEAAFPKAADGTRDFGFADPALNAKVAKAFENDEVYTRTVRVGKPEGNDGRPITVDANPVRVPRRKAGNKK